MKSILIGWGVVCFLIFLVLVHKKYIRISDMRYWALIGVAVILCLFIEGVCFNISALTTQHLVPVELDLLKDVSEQDNECIINEIDLQAETLYAVFSGPVKAMNVNVFLKDDAFRDEFVGADTCQVSPGSCFYNTAMLRIKSNGVLHSLKLSWDVADTNLTELVVNKPVAYNFSLFRFLLMLLICVTVITVHFFKLNQYVWNPSDRCHQAVYLSCMLLCILLSEEVNMLIQPYDSTRFPLTQTIQYPLVDDSIWQNAYNGPPQTHAILFDALLHGGVVQMEPDEQLLNLENPYDPSQRSVSGVPYLADFALYQGKYYVYFGITPILVCYFPFYLIFGYLPSYVMAALFFAFLTIIGGFACFWEIAKRYADRVSLVSLCLLGLAAVLGSNVLTLQSCADKYHLSTQSMQAFFFLSLWSGFRAAGKYNKGNNFLFFLCAVFTILLIWSRPSGAVAAAGWLIPLFILVLLDSGRTWKAKVKNSAAFLLPLLFGLAVIMYYNWHRFDSVFEFGQFYQLTCEDTSYNSIRIQDFPHAVFSYFFDGVTVTSDFPWVRPVKSFINHTGNYFYWSTSHGAMIMPITWGVALFSVKNSGSKERYTAVFLPALLSTVAVALLDYCYAGVTQRYICDILPTLCLIGAILILINGSFLRDQTPSQRDAVSFRICGLICAMTFLLVICFIFGNYRNFIKQYAPDHYLFFVRTLSVV